MKSKPPRTISAASHLKQRATACALGCLLALSACGGGGGGSPSASNGVGVGGTGSAAGPVTGFGSIIVNDIRFDDSSANVFNDDGTRMSRTDVKLGMLVDVRSGVFTDDATTGLRNATASQITYGSSLKGVVTAMSPVTATPTATASNSFTMLGQTVIVSTSTVFSGYANGLSSMSANDQVEVHALLSTVTGEFTATRIEKQSSLTECKLSGIVSNLIPTNRTFNLGGWAITGGVSTSDVALLANGKRVKVRLTYSAPTCGNTATRVQSSDIGLNESASMEVDGFVSDFVSASNFKVNGVPVSATTVPVGVGNGIRVEAEGIVRNGVLVASKVERKDLLSTDSVRLFGSPSPGSHAAAGATGTFVVQGQTVYYNTATTRFDTGVTTSTFNNPSASLEVRGALDSSGTVSPGTVIIASEIKLKN